MVGSKSRRQPALMAGFSETREDTDAKINVQHQNTALMRES
jgi:hypothetical protein